MKNCYLLLLALFCIAMSHAQDYDIFEGKWKGELKTSSYDCNYSETAVTIKKDGNGKYFGEFDARQTGNKYLNKKFTIHLTNGYFQNDRLVFDGKNEDSSGLFGKPECPMKFELFYSLKGDTAHLRGRFTNSPCNDSGHLWVIRKPSSKEFAAHENAIRDIKNVRLSDENANGFLENGEYACLSFDVGNKLHFAKDDFVLNFALTTDVVTSGIPELREEKNDRITLSYLVSSKSGKAFPALPYFISVKRNGAFEQIGKGTIDVRPEHFERKPTNQNLAVKTFEGFWIGNSGDGIYQFKPDGTARLNQVKMFSNWDHFKNPCNSEEYIALTMSQQFAIKSPLPPTTMYKIIKNSRPDDYFVKAVANLYGGANVIELHKIELPIPPDDILEPLEQLIVGKWYFDGSSKKINFKPNHDAVEHTPINGADFGTWFWTVRPVNGRKEYYLWSVAGKVFGTSKYRVDFEKSSQHHLILIDQSGRQDSITKDDTIEIPENYVGRSGNAGWLANVLIQNDEKQSGIKLFGPLINANAKLQSAGPEFYNELLKRIN